MNDIPFKTPSKKLILSVISSSAFITGLTLAVIWLYLYNLGRLDIFYDATNASSAVAVIFGFTILSLLGFSILIFSSSFMVMLIFSSYEKSLIKNNEVANSFSIVVLFNSLGLYFFLFACFIPYYYLNLNGLLTFIVSLIISAIFSFYITKRNILNPRKYSHSNEAKELLEKTSTKISLSLLLLIPAIVQILPISFFLSQLEFTEGSNDFAQISLLTAVALTFSILSIFPGIIYINEKKNGGVHHAIIMILIFIPTILVVLSLIFRPIPNMIINMTMNLSGISDRRTHQFYIKENIHPHAMFNGRLWNTRYFQGIPDKFFITGVRIFTLGNTQLICPTSITHARKESLKLTIDNSKEYDEKTNHLKHIAMDCIPFNKKDIQIWDSPIPEPIYYEKIKITNDNSMLNVIHSLK
ncbi:hypothetical protein [Serratia ficaria]|uniref:hypothetical protein n=1 Tax=Serratia ficaria TaxID=61651 RepID=UPI0021779DBA|nr:hypothetical protein [Serratia ficaria]CAI1153626.1 Uncharacterised protein [Serratia ficaria]CAI1221398.1 Uncharacterised protein [Serratia ficaria]CAI1772323.1 Uncharacterised protein [Serratia ficaria]CAI2534890.1 Uncharacterised protein [Serratia ficaria]CAI2538906.1 Uncharacterised protein [Serratia ficaria]